MDKVDKFIVYVDKGSHVGKEISVRVLCKIAKKIDLDLGKIRTALQEYVDRMNNADEREHARRLAAKAYAKIAKAVSDRKEKQMGGILFRNSPKTI